MIPMTVLEDERGVGVVVSTDEADVFVTPVVFRALIEVIAAGDLGDLQKLMALALTGCHLCGAKPSVSRDEYGAPRCETHERIAAESGWAAS